MKLFLKKINNFFKFHEYVSRILESTTKSLEQLFANDLKKNLIIEFKLDENETLHIQLIKEPVIFSVNFKFQTLISSSSKVVV